MKKDCWHASGNFFNCFHAIVFVILSAAFKEREVFHKKLHCDLKISSSCLKRFSSSSSSFWVLAFPLILTHRLNQPVANFVEELHIFEQLLHSKGNPPSLLPCLSFLSSKHSFIIELCVSHYTLPGFPMQDICHCFRRIILQIFLADSISK